MKKDTINYFMVGSFVLAMLILLLYSLYRITGQTVGSVKYFVLFDNVQALKKGASITYGGYHVGQMGDMQPLHEDGSTRYLLTLNIRGDWPIPVDSEAQILKPGLISDKTIEITAGRSRELLNPGDTINSREAVDMMGLITSIGNALDDFLPAVTDDVREIIGKINRNADQLSRILSDKNTGHLNSLFENADQASQKMAVLVNRFDSVNRQLETLLQRSTDMLSDNDMDIRQSVVELRKSMQNISSNMDSIMYNLNTSSRNMKEFTRQLRDNPGVLLGSKPPADAAEAH